MKTNQQNGESFKNEKQYSNEQLCKKIQVSN